MNELNNSWNALQELHDRYVITCFTDTTDIEENDKFIDVFTTIFIDIEAACVEFMSKPSSHTGNDSSGKQQNSIKLERVKFRTFDGDVRKYPKFKFEFNKFVAPLCAEKQLPFILKSYLCDSVRQEVETYDHDINAMWKRLDEKYGTIQKLIDCILSDLKNMPFATIIYLHWRWLD